MIALGLTTRGTAAVPPPGAVYRNTTSSSTRRSLDPLGRSIAKVGSLEG